MPLKLNFFWPCLVAIAATSAIEVGSDHTQLRVLIAEEGKKFSESQLIHSGDGDIPMPPGAPSAHASSLVSLPNQYPSALVAVWFAGAHESAPDVRIAFSSFDHTRQRWTPARYLVSRESLGESLGFGIRRLGNPVLWKDAHDRLHLFVVGTGPGGWAASRIIHLEQTSDTSDLNQLAFKPRQVLPLSWFWNISHLVRNAPLPMADGGASLPVYFEIGAKYPVMARMSPTGDFAGITRISSRRNLLQPALVAIDSAHWMAYMRMSGGTQKIAMAETRDGGQHWLDLPDLPLPNPNAAVAATGFNGMQAMVFNPSINSRDTLSLAIATDGRNWTTIVDLEKGKGGDEFSYPAMAWADNALWVSYTNRREKISWRRFALAKD